VTIPTGAIIHKRAGMASSGLFSELNRHRENRGLNYGVVLFNPRNGRLVVNKNIRDAETLVEYIRSFSTDFDLTSADIIVSREHKSVITNSEFAYQPFIEGILYHSLHHRVPVYFVTGNAMGANKVIMTPTQRNIIFSAVFNNPEYERAKANASTPFEIFAALKNLLTEKKPLENCGIIGIFPSVEAKLGSILYYNKDLFLYDKDTMLHFANNGSYEASILGAVGDDKSKDEDMSFLNKSKKDGLPSVEIIPEENDLSHLIVKEEPIEYKVGQLLQISFLSDSSSQLFSSLFNITSVNPLQRMVGLSRSFATSTEFFYKKVEVLNDMAVDLFNVEQL